MIDIEATVTIGPSYSTFDRLPAGFGNPGQTDLDRLCASLDYLRLCCEFGEHEAGERPGDRPVAEQVGCHRQQGEVHDV
jgi:hypothetical protein